MISRKSSVLSTTGFSSCYFTPLLKGLLACLLSGAAITVCGSMTRADAGTADPDQALRPFQLALANCCLGSRQFLGRSVDALWYWDLLNDFGLPHDDPVRKLLEVSRASWVRCRLGVGHRHRWDPRLA
jgi:hypothetical protein